MVVGTRYVPDGVVVTRNQPEVEVGARDVPEVVVGARNVPAGSSEIPEMRCVMLGGRLKISDADERMKRWTEGYRQTGWIGTLQVNRDTCLK